MVTQKFQTSGLHHQISPSLLLREFLDNHILESDINKKVSFFHKLVLEYFAADKPHDSYLLDPQSIRS